MADPVLHIKDSYYFDVPKVLWQSHRSERLGDNGFPEWWVELDPEFQQWEAKQVVDVLKTMPVEAQVEPPTKNGKPIEGWVLPAMPTDFSHFVEHYEHWKHEGHINFGVPMARYLAEAKENDWFQFRMQDEAWATKFSEAVAAKELTAARYDGEAPAWSGEKLNGYNVALSGKVMIPQPFGSLKNLYESSSGFCVSKYMVIEAIAALIIIVLFVRLAGKIRNGGFARGKFWNLLEVFLVFIRDEVVRPAIGKQDGDKFLPLIWTIFFFVLGCNLFGMLPWAGAPTAAFGVTTALAAVTLLVGFLAGSKRFGPIGFWKNLVPSMGLPFVLAIVLVPGLFLIEVGGLFIKHGVLAVRLLANMVAGHLVLLGIYGLAFSAEGAGSDLWGVTAVISVFGTTLFSLLELFVAFLQAYIFAFLSSLFIGSLIHHH